MPLQYYRAYRVKVEISDLKPFFVIAVGAYQTRTHLPDGKIGLAWAVLESGQPHLMYGKVVSDDSDSVVIDTEFGGRRTFEPLTLKLLVEMKESLPLYDELVASAKSDHALQLLFLNEGIPDWWAEERSVKEVKPTS